MEPVGEKTSPMAEGGLLVVLRKAAVPELPDQQIKVIVREVVGHISEAGELVEVEELVINVTGAISGGTDPSNAWRWNRLARGEHLLRSLRKLKHNPGR